MYEKVHKLVISLETDQWVPVGINSLALSMESVFLQVHILELGPHVEGNLAPWSYQDVIEFQQVEDRYDFPVSIQVRLHRFRSKTKSNCFL